MSDTGQPLTSNNREPVAFDLRTRRVMELRQQIREGTYRPSAEEVAAALLREWTALAGVTREPAAPANAASADARAFAGRFLVSPAAPEASPEAAMTA